MPLASAAASVVHDVNNSLGVIQSTAQFVLRHLKPSTQEKEAWELVERNVESIRRLLKSYLGLARQTEKPKELTSINELIERVTHFIDVQCTKNNIRIIKDLSMPLPRVMVESSAVESAILNLSLNAIEAIGQGGTLKFTTQDSESDKSVKFILEDSGPGISKETMENIFTPFFTTKENGTGMGLYSVKAILTQNNGKISCESQPGKTRMILTFFNA
jgi:signal transduction histidine kinase